MPWYSILPPQLIYLETWAATVFFALGIITIIPWVVLLAFDFVLYISRMSLYELPGAVGRARGAHRRDASVYAGVGNKTERSPPKYTSDSHTQGEMPEEGLDAKQGAQVGGLGPGGSSS